MWQWPGSGLAASEGGSLPRDGPFSFKGDLNLPLCCVFHISARVSSMWNVSSWLQAQLKKRGESDNHADGAAVPPSQLSRSPKSPFLPRAARVLPPAGGKDNGWVGRVYRGSQWILKRPGTREVLRHISRREGSAVSSLLCFTFLILLECLISAG